MNLGYCYREHFNHCGCNCCDRDQYVIGELKKALASAETIIHQYLNAEASDKDAEEWLVKYKGIGS